MTDEAETRILDVVALSPLQRGLYSVSTMSGDVDPYLVTFSVRVDGLDDLDRLHRAFDGVLARYPHLGGSVVTDGLPHPVLVITSAGRIEWRELDLREHPDADSAARQLYWDAGRERIDLDDGPLFRVTAARVGDRSYELVCSAHHIVVDGWSIPLLFADLAALYDGSDSLPPAPPLREHAAWLAARDTEASAAAWKSALADLAPMPMVGPPPADADLPVIGEARLSIDETAEITAWARRRGLTLNTLLQLAWARTLSGLLGRDDVVFGQTTSGRDSSLPNADRIVGALVTTIPVRVRLDDRDPAEIGAQVQRDVARLRAHEYLGIADITRHAGVGQLFDTLLVFENSPTGAVSASMPLGEHDGSTLNFRRIDSPSHYPIAVVPVVEGGELISRVEIRPDLAERFVPDTLAQRVLAAVRGITRAAVASDADILLDDEPAVLTGPPATLPSQTDVPSLLLAAARRAGTAVAVVDEDGEQSFDDFAAAVETLAANLRAGGVQPGDAVAVMLPRDRRVLQAPFAVGRAGAVCVHIDPSTPADRVAYLLETSGARVLLGDNDHGLDVTLATPDAEGNVAGWQGTEIGGHPELRRDDPFYTVFTSGTTGRPKGVVTSHGALLNHWSNHERRFFAPTVAKLGRQLRIAHGWSTGFDAAWQPTVALLSGHTVVLLGEQVRTDAEQIVAAIDRYGIDMLDTSPSMLARLIDAGLFTSTESVERCALSVLALGGEAISADNWRRLRGLESTRVVNFYGPTETTVEALSAEVLDHPAPTIGVPFDGMSAEVLDHRLRPVPPGGQGELYLSGPQLAQGYLARPATTAGAFVAGPRGRRYRTGDLVRRTPEGTVVYEGRIDNQVKINGYRVEPAESAVVMRELDGIAHAEALAFVDNGRTRLGALVVSERSIADIRSELVLRLPQFLVPTRIVAVERIPLNRNDKLDVHEATALLTRRDTDAGSAEPETDTERLLLDLVGTMSAGGRTSLSDSLFDLGIDSIGVIDLVSRLRGADFAVTAHDVLAATDIRDLAQRLDRATEAGERIEDADVVPAGTRLPLTPLALEIVGHGNYRPLAQTQLVTLPAGTTAEQIIERLDAVAVAHPTLRSQLVRSDDGTAELLVGTTSSAADTTVTVEVDGDRAPFLAQTVDRLDPDAGRMVAATLLVDGAERSLLLSVHHLAIDVVSWLIVLDDLRRLDRGAAPVNETPVPPEPTTPTDTRVLGAPLGGRHTDPSVDRTANAIDRTVELGAPESAALLERCRRTGESLEDVLLRACARTFADTAENGAVAVTRESHGRPADDDTRRVGWFTVEETSLIPLDGSDRTVVDGRGQIRLNHLGRFDVLSWADGPWTPVPFDRFTAEFGVEGHPDLPLRFGVDVSTAVIPRDGEPRVAAQFSCNGALLDDAEVTARTQTWLAVLGETDE